MGFKFDQMKDLISIQERVNRLFGDVMDKENDDAVQNTWSPLVDIYEADNEFVVKAELPEVKQEDIDIRIENNVLLIKGERKRLKGRSSESFHRVERKYGFFKRSFRLPASVDQDQIKAGLKDGILSVVLPKKKDTGTVQVEIR